ncbi:trypsin-like serine protease [uncultured Gilvimarinus sp.]|uniref:S1 family peptidase n=1 Tax=uncultured Gilvimarinus sp. TaxID=1689143 RepID=UPI0030ED4904|tara:strand:- start:2763 stop:3500 length:738 start_codon:yes stop_codon:yes gene_type:complete
MKLAVYVILLALITISPAHGIIIRHDVSDKKHQELGEQYSSSVAYIGGCMATLVEPDWLLTAAHCMRGESVDIKTAMHLEAEYQVEKIFVHPDRDIALVQLKDPVRNGEPVTLYNQIDEVGKVVVFVGNGVSGNGRNGLTGEDGNLRGARNTVIEATQYNLVFLFDKPETATNLEGISGPGDSGGPALVEIDELLYVVGVSAYQKGNGFEEGHYGVKEYYSRVSAHYLWLREIIDNARPAHVPEH